jgi:hypothetical protein
MSGASKLVVAVASFVADVDGEARIVRAGDVLPANDQVVKGREALFEPHDPNRPDRPS